MSADTTSSDPRLTTTIAASSPTPSTAWRGRVAKSRWISSNSDGTERALRTLNGIVAVVRLRGRPVGQPLFPQRMRKIKIDRRKHEKNDDEPALGVRRQEFLAFQQHIQSEQAIDDTAHVKGDDALFQLFVHYISKRPGASTSCRLRAGAHPRQAGRALH